MKVRPIEVNIYSRHQPEPIMRPRAYATLNNAVVRMTKLMLEEGTPSTFAVIHHRDTGMEMGRVSLTSSKKIVILLE